jgi:predicted component of type VI protein secretion system
MSELTLQWTESGQIRRHTYVEGQPTKTPGVFRLGRDPQHCDLILADPTVSGLHVELYWQTATHQVWLRNLRSTNPPLVDGVQLFAGEAPLRQGSRINMGRVELSVLTLAFSAVPPPQPQPSAPSGYGLKCPNPACGKVSSYNDEILRQGCPWCGFSLASAPSVVIFPNS